MTKALALGATGIGIGRAALLAVHECRTDGLVNLVRCLALELRMLISALGQYTAADVSHEDLWPAPCEHAAAGTPQPGLQGEADRQPGQRGTR